MYQKEDAEALGLDLLVTNISIKEIENLKGNNINDLKILLANKTTEMLHGSQEAKNSEKIAKDTFSENSSGSNLTSIKIDKKKINKKFNIF